MSKRAVFILGVILLAAGVGCKKETTPPTMGVSLSASNDGTTINLLISSPSSDTLGILCGDGTPLDTVIVGGADTVIYTLDSTFLKVCEEHNLLKIAIYPGTFMLVLLENVPIGTKDDTITINGRDTVILRGDTTGYEVISSRYVKLAEYAGGLYAPLPPSSYGDTVSADSSDTLVVWIDYDHDGASGYDGDDVFGVLIIGPDRKELRVLAYTSGWDTFTGYRGLDLCFKCIKSVR